MDDLDDVQFVTLVNASQSFADMQQKLGIPLQRDRKNPNLLNKYSSSLRAKITKRCDDLGVSWNHLKFKLKPRKDMKSKRRRTSCLRNILRKSGKLYICEICRCEDMDLHDGEWIWNGKPIQLEIDHIKGNCSKDDDVDDPSNLRWLCGNCHKSTSNWGQSNRTGKLHFQAISDKRKTMERKGHEYICAECKCCNMTKEHHYWLWKDWPLNLEIDHIQGRKIDNPHSKENTRWLCRNCHSQTNNFCGRGKKLAVS